MLQKEMQRHETCSCEEEIAAATKSETVASSVLLGASPSPHDGGAGTLNQRKKGRGRKDGSQLGSAVGGFNCCWTLPSFQAGWNEVCCGRLKPWANRHGSPCTH